MKTVVTEVLEYFEQFGLIISDENKVKFLEKERQQLIKFYENGVTYFANYDPERHGNDTVTGIQHYNNTFYTTNKETLK